MPMTAALLSRRGHHRANTDIENEGVEKSSKKIESESAMECLRVLELYSGIGGMHCALKGKVRMAKSE